MEISLCGYHAYTNIPLTLGQKLLCDIEPENEYDPFAVMVQTENEELVSHIPIEFSKVLYKFLTDGGEAVAEVIGKRYKKGTNIGHGSLIRHQMQRYTSIFEETKETFKRRF